MEEEDRKLFMVEMGNAHVITWARDREEAKRAGYVWLGGDRESYIVTPLTEKGDRIHLSLTLFV